MVVTEAIILAGGLGTRLREAVPDLPKCMAPIRGIPFIFYVIQHLKKQGIQRFLFSLGYRSEAFTKFLADTLAEGTYEMIIEKEPLGTGGAIQFAMQHAITEKVLVVNGDSIFMSTLLEQSNFHDLKKADCTLALKSMENFSRYGVVELNTDQSIALFKEKQFYEKGLINGGVYIIDKTLFTKHRFPEKFSFETDYLQQYHTAGGMYGIEQDGYFIDIGIPEDYQRAQTELTY